MKSSLIPKLLKNGCNKNQHITECKKVVASGCFIYLACHERYTFPTAEFLIHKGAGQFSGSYNDVVAAIINYQRQIDDLGSFVLKRTKIPEDVFYENFENDWYLSSKEAIEYGVADGYIKSLDEII